MNITINDLLKLSKTLSDGLATIRQNQQIWQEKYQLLASYGLFPAVNLPPSHTESWQQMFIKQMNLLLNTYSKQQLKIIFAIAEGDIKWLETNNIEPPVLESQNKDKEPLWKWINSQTQESVYAYFRRNVKDYEQHSVNANLMSAFVFRYDIHLAAGLNDLAYLNKNYTYFHSERQTNIKLPQYGQLTPLQYAARTGSSETIKFLLTKEINTEDRLKNIRPALYHAVRWQNLEAVKTILNWPNLKVEINNIQEMQNLDSWTTFLNKPDTQCDNPLCLALANKNDDIARLFIEKKLYLAEPDHKKQTPLHYVIIENKEEIFDLILKQQPQLSNQLIYDLAALAIEKNNLSILQKLLTHYDNQLDTESAHQLFCAASVTASPEIFEYLLNQLPVESYSGNETPLEKALAADKKEIIELILKKYPLNQSSVALAEAQWQKLYPYFYRYYDEHNESFKKLKSSNAPCNWQDRQGNTALHYAVANGDLDSVRFLLNKRPIVPHQQNKDCDTPLHKAASLGHLEICKELVKVTTLQNINTLNKLGGTALQAALIAQQKEVIKYLLTTKSFNINQFSKDCPSTLQIATLNNDLDTVRLLLENGALPDCSFQSQLRDEPLILAFKSQHPDSPQILAALADKATILPMLLLDEAQQSFEEEDNKEPTLRNEALYQQITEKRTTLLKTAKKLFLILADTNISVDMLSIICRLKYIKNEIPGEQLAHAQLKFINRYVEEQVKSHPSKALTKLHEVVKQEFSFQNAGYIKDKSWQQKLMRVAAFTRSCSTNGTIRAGYFPYGSEMASQFLEPRVCEVINSINYLTESSLKIDVIGEFTRKLLFVPETRVRDKLNNIKEEILKKLATKELSARIGGREYTDNTGQTYKHVPEGIYWILLEMEDKQAHPLDILDHIYIITQGRLGIRDKYQYGPFFNLRHDNTHEYYESLRLTIEQFRLSTFEPAVSLSPPLSR